MSHRSPNTDPDPWSRPEIADVREFEEHHGSRQHHAGDNVRAAERFPLSVPAEITTSRGSVIPAITRDISRFGVGLLLRGFLPVSEVVVKMASDTREYKYKVEILWCQHFKNGMFAVGGKFLGKVDEEMPGS